MLKKIIVFIALLLSLTSCNENTSSQIIEGAINPHNRIFEGFYGLSDSLTKVLQDSFTIIINSHPTNELIKQDIKAYNYLNKNNLLERPCKIFSADGQAIRVYFTPKDFIKATDLINSSTAEQEGMIAYLIMDLNLIDSSKYGTGDIYECKAILKREYREIEEDTLQMEEDIIVTPYSLEE